MPDDRDACAIDAPGRDPRIGALAHLPAAYAALAPELDTLAFIEESRADCSRCPMVPPAAGAMDDGPWVFHPEARCCTFHPSLANFLAGRALLAGGVSAEAIQARVRSGLGVTAWGITPPEGWRERYQRVATHEFGRDVSLRCPYWVGGERACGIWPARPATCRTWFCKHDHGLHGAVVWTQLRVVLSRIGALLAEHCIETGQPPEPGDRTPEAATGLWLDWYRDCAHRVERMDAAELARVSGDDVLAGARADLRHLCERPARVLPDVVVPAVRETMPDPGGVRVSGYSIYDTVVAPRSLFRFLARLDGTRTWREARAASGGDADGGAAMPGGPEPDDETIAELHRVGALEAPGEPDATVIERNPWPPGDGSPGQLPRTIRDE